MYTRKRDSFLRTITLKIPEGAYGRLRCVTSIITRWSGDTFRSLMFLMRSIYELAYNELLAKYEELINAYDKLHEECAGLRAMYELIIDTKLMYYS